MFLKLNDGLIHLDTIERVAFLGNKHFPRTRLELVSGRDREYDGEEADALSWFFEEILPKIRGQFGQQHSMVREIVWEYRAIIETKKSVAEYVAEEDARLDSPPAPG